MVWLVRLFARLNYNSIYNTMAGFHGLPISISMLQSISAQLHYVMEMPKTTLFSHLQMIFIRFDLVEREEKKRMAFEFELERHHHRHAVTSPNSVSFMAACRICRPLQLYLLISGLSVFSCSSYSNDPVHCVPHVSNRPLCECFCCCGSQCTWIGMCTLWWIMDDRNGIWTLLEFIGLWSFPFGQQRKKNTTSFLHTHTTEHIPMIETLSIPVQCLGIGAFEFRVNKREMDVLKHSVKVYDLQP